MNFLIAFRCCVLMSLLLSQVCVAQLSASFTSPSSACLQETIAVTNTSQNASSFVWDFCDKDLEATPTAAVTATLPTTGTFYYYGIRIVYDQGIWVGIATDINGQKIYRLNFGADPTSTPVITDLGNFGVLTSPGAIEMYNENGTWYSFVANGYGSGLVRVDWGNGILAAPTQLTNFGNIGGLINGAEGIKAIASGGEHYVFVTNTNVGNITVLKFGSSFSNTIQQSKTIGGSAGLNGPWGIDILSDNANWFGLLSCRNAGKVYKISFGTDLFGDPAFVEIGNVAEGVTLKFVREGSNFVGLIRSRSLGLYRVQFGNSMSNSATIDNLGHLGALQNESRSFDLIRNAPNWHAFSLDVTTARLVRMDFYGNCLQNMTLNNSNQNNSEQTYKTAGNYTIELTAIDNSGNRAVTSASIAVTNVAAAAVSILTDASRCLGVANSFSTSSTQPITQYDWDFNGQSTSSASNPSYQFGQAGTKNIMLKITDVNGCHNKATTSLTIYNPPSPDFNQPIITGTVCTEQPYQFTNATTFDAGSNPTWQWAVDAQLVTTSQNLTHTFHQVTTFGVTLASSIPGCATSITKNFTLTGAGTAVDFNFVGQCFGDVTQFTNNTSGSITSHTWTFGDGQVSNQPSPSHQFAGIGSYSVSLQVTNVGGCTNSMSQSVIITTAPVPDFYIDLPPFSCSGTPTQFHDATQAPIDGNIISWDWDFNDGSGATSLQQNPLHTYVLPGTYQVSLKAKTNFGCEATVQLPIEIAASPVSDFSVDPACLNKGTTFKSLNAQNISSWNWTIGSSVYSIPEPIHTFTTPGTYPAMLVVIGNNGCEGLITKSVTVNPTPSLDFTTTSLCAGQPTLFTGTVGGPDLPNAWSWIFDGTAGAGSPVSFTFPVAGAKSVRMTLSVQSGCDYSITKNVIIAPSPKASFTASPTFGAPPLMVQFNNTSLNASSLSWDLGFNNSTATSTNPTFTYTQLGDYLVQLTASNSAGCSDSHSQIINVMQPNYNLTIENLTVQESSTSYSKTPIISLKNNSNVSVTSADVWVTGSTGMRVKSTLSLNLVPGASQQLTLPIEVFTNEKYICVELDVANDADESDNISCQNLQDKPVLAAPYPNPTTGVIWFDAVLDEVSVGSLRISDSKGKTVFAQNFGSLSQGLNRIEINFSNQSPGLYLAIWTVNGKQIEFRFLLQ